MKLIPKKGGNGYVSSFTINISLSSAKRCGFLDQDGIPYDIVLEEHPETKTIIIRLKQEAE